MKYEKTSMMKYTTVNSQVVMEAFYDVELDRKGFEVTFTTNGNIVSRIPYDDQSEASTSFHEIVETMTKKVER